MNNPAFSVLARHKRLFASLALLTPLVNGCGDVAIAADSAADASGSTNQDSASNLDINIIAPIDANSQTAADSGAYCTADANDLRAPFVIQGMEQEMRCGALLVGHIGQPCIQPGFRCAQNVVNYGYSADCPVNCPRIWIARGGGGPLAPPELLG